MLRSSILMKCFKYIELAGVILTLCLLPIDRFPYLHYIPLKLGAISFVLLLVAAAARFTKILVDKRWPDLKRVGLVIFLLLLPVAGYAQSIHYAIDRILAVGATKLLLIVALKAICFYIILYENPAMWKTIKKTIYAVTAVIVAYGFFQFIFDVFGASTHITDLRSCCTSNSTFIFPRVHSVSLEPLYFSNFLLLPLWLMLFDFIFDKKQRKNKYLLLLFAAVSSLFVLSLARSAMLALLISTIIFVLGFGKRASLKKAVPYMAKGGVAIVILVVSFVMLSGLASKHIHKSAINGSEGGVSGSVAIFSNHAIAVADESAQTRYSTWPKAIEFFKEEPLKGIGAYNSRVRLHINEYKAGTQDIKLQPFNNDFLGLLVDLGLIGLITFGPVIVSLMVSLIKSFKRHWNTHSAPYALAAAAMLLQTNFFQSILLARLWIVIGIALAGIYSRDKIKRSYT